MSFIFVGGEESGPAADIAGLLRDVTPPVVSDVSNATCRAAFSSTSRFNRARVFRRCWSQNTRAEGSRSRRPFFRNEKRGRALWCCTACP